jgi:hypothetical protein
LDNSDTQANRPTIAMNARDFAWQIDRTIMASRPSIRIARKARSKAESDFATWLMMAKLLIPLDVAHHSGMISPTVPI